MLQIFNNVTHEMFETVELLHHSTCGTEEIHDNSWCVCVCVCIYTHTHTHTIPYVLTAVYTGHFQDFKFKGLPT